MYVIAGLGNPSKEYNGTRHNIGFAVVDRLADRHFLSLSGRKHKAYCAKGTVCSEKVILAKPQTYMNLSGESIRQMADYYKVDPSQIIIIYDDVSLEPGNIRVRRSGSAGGHNGIKSIIAHLGTMEFPRVKVGIGEKPKEMDLADYVLGHFSKAEAADIDEGIDRAVAAVETILKDGVDQAMNLYNSKKR